MVLLIELKASILPRIYRVLHTEKERKNIEEKAVHIAGATNVTNQLAVKGDETLTK